MWSQIKYELTPYLFFFAVIAYGIILFYVGIRLTKQGKKELENQFPKARQKRPQVPNHKLMSTPLVETLDRLEELGGA